MRKIIIDLDIITVAAWNKKGEETKTAQRFIARVQNNEFSAFTPFFLIELVGQWLYSALAEDIKQFYLKNTSIITNEDLENKVAELDLDDKKILLELRAKGVKGEDALLALVTSIFSMDYLVTFNQKHLRSNVKMINEVMKDNGLKEIRLVGPEGI